MTSLRKARLDKQPLQKCNDVLHVRSGQRWRVGGQAHRDLLRAEQGWAESTRCQELKGFEETWKVHTRGRPGVRKGQKGHLDTGRMGREVEKKDRSLLHPGPTPPAPGHSFCQSTRVDEVLLVDPRADGAWREGAP